MRRMKIRTSNGAFQESFQQILANHRTSMVRGNFQASDPRDYVYGTLGLRAESASSPLTPDYSLSVPQVFAQAARYFAQSDGTLEVLNLCDPADERWPDALSPLPTWMPDWASPARTTSGTLSFGDISTFSASAGMRCIVRDSSCWNQLCVRGKLIHRIDETLRDYLKYLPQLFVIVLLCHEEDVPVVDEEMIRMYLSHPWGSHAAIIPCLIRWALLRYNGDRSNRTSDEAISAALMNLEKAWKKWSYLPFYTPPKKPMTFLKAMLNVDAARILGGRCTHHIPYSQCPRLECREIYLIYRYVLSPLVRLKDEAEVFVTTKGVIGITNKAVRAGDVVAILHGYDTPAVLRRQGEMGPYQYVSGCYLENAMYGEEVTWREDEADEIVLV